MSDSRSALENPLRNREGHIDFLEIPHELLKSIDVENHGPLNALSADDED